MRRKSLVLLLALALGVVFTFSSSDAFAKNSYFILKNIKTGSSTLSLSSVVDKTITADINQAAGERPALFMNFSAMRNKSTTSKANLTISFASTGDSRQVTITGKVKVTVNKSGSKIVKVQPLGDFTVTGTDSGGTPIATATFSPAAGSFTKAGNKGIKIDSEILVGSLENDAIGTIGQEAGTYTYSLKATGIPLKKGSKIFTTVAGTLEVTE